MFISTRKYLQDIKRARKEGYEKAMQKFCSEREMAMDIRSCHEEVNRMNEKYYDIESKVDGLMSMNLGKRNNCSCE